MEMLSPNFITFIFFSVENMSLQSPAVCKKDLTIPVPFQPHEDLIT